jgi:hypothetical protein
MAKKATRLMREAAYRWAIWRAEGTPGELDLACRLARQALAWAVRQRQAVLAGQARRLVAALERDRREYEARCWPLVEAAARAQEIIPADELEAGIVREPAVRYAGDPCWIVARYPGTCRGAARRCRRAGRGGVREGCPAGGVGGVPVVRSAPRWGLPAPAASGGWQHTRRGGGDGWDS